MLEERQELRRQLRQELKYRLAALPAALIGAYVLVRVSPLLTRVTTMLLHEGGHAVTAWLCGFSAIPGLWFTPISSERVPLVSVVVVGLVGLGGYRFWRARLWGPVAAAAFILILKARFTLLPLHDANALIAFGGDAGAMALGAVLMSAFYVRRSSVIYENGLRWGFLAIGAVAFMDPFALWAGGAENIEFGEINGQPSDPSLMVDLYGWGISDMVQRYVSLGVLCLTVLGVIYLIGILSVWKEMDV
jgi:hypothetical protein